MSREKGGGDIIRQICMKIYLDGFPPLNLKHSNEEKGKVSGG